MSHFVIAVGAAIAVIAVAVPIAAMILVSVASRREESGHTLSGQAPGAITRAARRLLAYRAESRPRPASVKDAALRPSSRTSAQVAPARPSAGARPRPATEPVTISLAPDPAQEWRAAAGTHAA